MKKCPVCEQLVGDAAIICTSCKNIITEPERTKKQKLGNFITGAITVAVLLGLSFLVYFTLRATPVSSFIKDNTALWESIAKTDTPLLSRLESDTFRAHFTFTLKDVRHIPSGKTGDCDLNLRFLKTKYDAAAAAEYNLNGLQIENLLLFNRGDRVYLGRPGENPPDCYMDLNAGENMLLTDRLPILLTQFKTKDELLRFWNGVLTLFAETVETKYISSGQGSLTSRISGETFVTDTSVLLLDSRGLKDTFTKLGGKLSETPNAYEDFDRMFKNLTVGKSFRSVMENDLKTYFGSLPDSARLVWTVHKKSGTPVAAEIKYFGISGVHSLFIQNEFKQGKNHLYIVLDLPAGGLREKLKTEFDILISTRGDYAEGKAYAVVLKAGIEAGGKSLYAEIASDTVLKQTSSGRYENTGGAHIKLVKDGMEKSFDVDCSLVYDFVEITELADFEGFPVSAVTDMAGKTSPEGFVRALYEACASSFLPDDFTPVKAEAAP